MEEGATEGDKKSMLQRANAAFRETGRRTYETFDKLMDGNERRRVGVQ